MRVRRSSTLARSDVDARVARRQTTKQRSAHGGVLLVELVDELEKRADVSGRHSTSTYRALIAPLVIANGQSATAHAWANMKHCGARVVSKVTNTRFARSNLDKLIDARVDAVTIALVANRHESFFGRNARQAVPGGARAHDVDLVAPAVDLQQRRRRAIAGVAERRDLRKGRESERGKRGNDE